MGLLEFRDFGLSGESDDICIDLIEGYRQPVSVRGRDWIVPKLTGRIEGNRRADVMILPLAGFVKGSGATPTERLESFNLNVTAVMAVMDPSLDSGTLRLSAGYLGLPAGSEATLECRVRNAAPGKIQSYPMVPLQLWTFELESLIPEWDLGSS
jgi:hypothetical protein